MKGEVLMTRTNYPINTVLDRLELKRQKSADTWRAKCPVHQSAESRSQTLSITETDTGAVLLNCFAGCDFDSILSILGLERRDLFPSDNYIRSFSKGNHKPRPNYRILVDRLKDALMLIHVYVSHIEKHPKTPTELNLDEKDLIILRGALTNVEEVLYASTS
jgi:hypothetical protein